MRLTTITIERYDADDGDWEPTSGEGFACDYALRKLWDFPNRAVKAELSLHNRPTPHRYRVAESPLGVFFDLVNSDGSYAHYIPDWARHMIRLHLRKHKRLYVQLEHYVN